MPQEIPSTLVKADRIGRNHYTAEFKAEVLAAFEASSLSGQAFAEQCGIKYPTFASWRAKARCESEPPQNVRVSESFVLAEFASSNADRTNGLSVELPGGALAHVADETSARLLAVLIKALA